MPRGRMASYPHTKVFLIVAAVALCFWSLACDRDPYGRAPMKSKSNLYPNGSVFTVDILENKQEQERIPRAIRPPRDLSFDVAVLEFNDDGKYVEQSQLEAVEDWIGSVRRNNDNPNGAIVVLFIHGWHHSAVWNSPTDGDSHFQSFRLLLASLALREAERALSRRVVGIYVGWNGDPKHSPFNLIKWIPGLTKLTFWNRYDTAERIGAGEDLRNAIQTITSRTKEPIYDGGNGQLILAGHSMGGLMLESALLALIEDASTEMLQRLPGEPTNPIAIRIDTDRILFPDAVISLNSAADSQISRRIKSVLAERKVNKEASGAAIRYNPPLAVAVTSTADEATGDWWPRAKPGRRTVGHDASLFTHTVTSDAETRLCIARGDTHDYGQNFHCLRYPEPKSAATPTMVVDLPVREREGLDDWPEHRRYRLHPMGDINEPELFWNFQVPPELIGDHNDIFNSRAASMILALIQMSGAVASLAQDWDDSFEE